MSIRIGGIEDADLDAFVRTMSTPFAFDIGGDDMATHVAEMRALFEVDRARCAFADDRIVGTLGAFTLPLTIPGGMTSAAGTTMVTVLPTHRRRGALRGMLTAHFEDARERNEFLAALWASDSAIYHRFGYGMAAVNAKIRVDRSHVKLHRLAPEPRAVRLVGPEDVRDLVGGVYSQVAAVRPGMYQRSGAWWDRRLRDRPSDRHGATAFRFAVVEGPGGVDGYLQYRLDPGKWEGGHGDGEVQVRELIATSPEAAVSLWSYALEHDLVAGLSASNLPEDDPLFSFLDGWRRAAPSLSDNLWVRILDIRAALDARRYAADGTLIMSVHDPVQDTHVTHRLTVEDGHGHTEPVTSEPDVQLDIEDLSAAYLGRARFRQLARAGRARGSRQALEIADRMFAWDPPPWCQEVF